MGRSTALFGALTLLFAFVSRATIAAEPAWVDAMRQVHARSTGEPGVLLHLGDSITYSMAYFAPLQFADKAKMPPAVRSSFDRVRDYLQPECFRWKGPDKGNLSGKTAAWALDHVDRWLDELKPEAAVILFGTNDIRQGSVADHERNLRKLVQRCLERGVVVILSTIPPMHGYDERVEQAVAAQRQLAADLKVPLIDFHSHVIQRRPGDWDGAAEEFAGFDQWEVPTLISRDGVHPSNPSDWKDDYSEEGLCRNGNVLRSYLTLMAYAEVIDVVFRGVDPGETSRSILGADPPKPIGLPASITGAGSQVHPSTIAAMNHPPVQDWFPKAPPLPEPTGQVIEVSSVEGLYDAAERVSPAGTIMIRDGVYSMPQTLVIRTDGVTLRGASGDRTRVVLDFADCRHHEGVAFTSCSDVTLADVTIANVRQNGIKINTDTGVDRVTIHNVVGHNIWQRHVKGVKSPDVDGQPTFVEDCRVQYCLFYNDRPKRRGDEPWEDENPRMGFNYIGGIDVMSARNWSIRDNVFLNINGQSGEARGAIFLWHHSIDCLIERNIIIDCDSGICLGNSSARGALRHAVNCLVRNNFVVRCSESNLLADHTRDCKILHNSVHDPDSKNGRLLRVVHANDGLIVFNNLFSGPRIALEAPGDEIQVENNLIRPVSGYFVDPERGNLHLTGNASDAIDAGRSTPLVTDDLDQQVRDSRPDLGADESIPPAR